MISIEEHHVDALASNAGAVRNARALAAKGRYSTLCVSDDGSIVFGDCRGSGARPYACSFDFAEPAKPVSRCSCPSRQIPCKHSLGLLYAWVEDASRFARTELPGDLEEKREAAVRRAAAKRARAAAPAAGPTTDGPRAHGSARRRTAIALSEPSKARSSSETPSSSKSSSPSGRRFRACREAPLAHRQRQRPMSPEGVPARQDRPCRFRDA